MRKVVIVCVVACLAVIGGASSGGAITNGQPDDGAHPEVGGLVGSLAQFPNPFVYCSGVLISPTVFLTAAHCGFLGTETVQVTFDEVYTAGLSTLHTGTFHAHPGFRPGSNAKSGQNPDIAVVVFSTPIPGITPADLPSAGLLDQLRAGGTLDQQTPFTAVGYGDSAFSNGPGGKTTTRLQARYVAVSRFNSLSAAYLHLKQNAGNGGTCSGDSGGPDYLGAGATETNIVAGITVTGDTYCKATNVDLRLDTQLARDFLDDYVTLP